MVPSHMSVEVLKLALCHFQKRKQQGTLNIWFSLVFPQLHLPLSSHADADWVKYLHTCYL